MLATHQVVGSKPITRSIRLANQFNGLDEDRNRYRSAWLSDRA
jgi:hypothetical protein